MRFLVLLCVFCVQFSFSQESKIVVDTKLRVTELAKKMRRIHDSLLLKYDSIANDSSIKDVFDLDETTANICNIGIRIYFG